MSQEKSVNPLGIFKRESKGFSLPPVNVAIERGRLRFFSQVLGETDPIHTDLAAAREAGHPDIVAPPSFFMAVEALANDERERDGARPIFDIIGCDYGRLLHGDEHYTYHGSIYAGDELSYTTTIIDFQDKKGGLLEFALLNATLTHAERGVLVSVKRSLVHNLAGRESA